MTSRIVVNNIEPDAGISTVTVNGDFDVTGDLNTTGIGSFGGSMLLVGTTNSTTVGTVNKNLIVGSTTNNDEVGLTLNVMEGSNNRRVKLFLDDDDGVFGVDSSSSTGTPSFVVRMATSEKLIIDQNGATKVCHNGGAFGVGGDPINKFGITTTDNNFFGLHRSNASTGTGEFNINVEADSQVTFSIDDEGAFSFGTSTDPSAQSGYSEKLRIQSDGKLLIGSSNPSNNARLGNELCIVGTEAYTGMSITNYPGTNAAHAPLFDFNRSRGTSDQSLTSVVAGDKLGEIIFRGANGSAFADAVTLRAYADSVGGGHVDGRYEISTSQGGSMDIRFRVNENGHITAPNNVAFSARNGPSDVTNNVIIFGTLVFQRGGGNYDTSTGIFTAPVDGIYHFMCNPYRYETSSDSQIMLERSTNGGSSWSYEFEVRRTNNYDGDNGRGWSTLSLSQIMDLNANDQVRIRAINRVHCNGVYSRFSGFLVA